ncbi:MAG: helix-turn-helix domain-containing protein [Thermoplasmata archaeon]
MSEISRNKESMYAAAFEARHDCPVGMMSRDQPDLRILHWCLNNRDIFQVSGPEEQLDSFQSRVDDVFGMRYYSRLHDSSLLITKGCRCVFESRRSVSDIIEEVGVWDIPPIVYRDGWESWRIIAWDEGSIRDLFKEIRALGKVRINSLRPIENARMEQMMLVPASDLFSGITDRQLSAVILGLENGYYSMPSETKVDRLAQGAGLAPSTFSEHLRKAETRIFRNLRPYLQAYSARMPGEAVIGEVRRLNMRMA